MVRFSFAFCWRSDRRGGCADRLPIVYLYNHGYIVIYLLWNKKSIIIYVLFDYAYYINISP